MNRHWERGWRRIGRIDAPGRRSLWIRESTDALELCAGREGDDAYVRITPENPQWRDLQEVLSRARFAAEWEDDDGMTLEREAALRGEPSDIPPGYAWWLRWSDAWARVGAEVAHDQRAAAVAADGHRPA